MLSEGDDLMHVKIAPGGGGGGGGGRRMGLNNSIRCSRDVHSGAR